MSFFSDAIDKEIGLMKSIKANISNDTLKPKNSAVVKMRPYKTNYYYKVEN